MSRIKNLLSKAGSTVAKVADHTLTGACVAAASVANTVDNRNEIVASAKDNATSIKDEVISRYYSARENVPVSTEQDS